MIYPEKQCHVQFKKKNKFPTDIKGEISLMHKQLTQVMIDMGRLHTTLAQKVIADNPELNLQRRVTEDEFITFCDELTVDQAKRESFVSFVIIAWL